MVTRAFDHRRGAGVTYRKALASGTGSKQRATRSPIEAGVADNGRFVALELADLGRHDDDAATVHAFTDVVVGIAFQVEVQATSVPYAKALARHAGKARGDRCGLKAIFTVTLGNGTGGERTDTAVAVGDGKIERAARLRLNGLFQRRQDFLVFGTRVVGHVTAHFTELRRICRHEVVRQQRH